MLVTIEEKQIAKEILIEMLKTKDYFIREEYPESKTVAEMICSAYKEVVKTISEIE